MKKLNLVEFAPNSFLYLKKLEFKRLFGVTLCISKGTEESKQVMTFEAFIELKRSKTTPNALVLTYDKRDVRINHSNELTNVQGLALKCAEAFYPIEMELIFSENTMDLLNEEEILRRWQEIRKKLDDYYTDQNSQWYLDQTESSLNSNRLDSLMEQDFFLSIFLGLHYPIWDRRKFPPMDIPIMPGRMPVEYTGTQKILSEYTSHDTIVINRTGAPNDNRSCQEMLNGFPQVSKTEGASGLKGDLSIKYEIEKETHIIQSIIGKVSLELTKNHLREVEFSVYHLWERDKEFEQQDEVKKEKPNALISFFKSLVS